MFAILSFIKHFEKVLAVFSFEHTISKLFELLPVNITLTVGNLFNTGSFKPLPFLDNPHKLTGLLDPLHDDRAHKGMDRALVTLLFFTSATGLALLVWRETGAMAVLLAVHLGFVMALFLTLPYGKFAHGVYRAAALLKWSIERRQPSRLQLGPE